MVRVFASILKYYPSNCPEQRGSYYCSRMFVTGFRRLVVLVNRASKRRATVTYTLPAYTFEKLQTHEPSCR